MKALDYQNSALLLYFNVRRINVGRVFTIENNVEIVHHDDEVIIADHKNFRYIKTKNSLYFQFIEKHLEFGIEEECLYNKSSESLIDSVIMKKLIDKLLELEIVVVIENFDYTEQFNKITKLDTNMYNRFFYEIEAFSFYEKFGINRVDAFQKVMNGKVAIVGAGGVGSNLAVMLSASGIGNIILVDADIVEESNLVRQIFYESADCGTTKKVIALKRFLDKFTKYTKVNAIESYITCVQDALEFLQGVDVVIQTADTPRGVINRIINDFSTISGCSSIYCANATVLSDGRVVPCCMCFNETKSIGDLRNQTIINNYALPIPDININSTQNIFEIRNCTFSYDNESELISNFSLSINQGEKIALVGYNGIGKTTLLKLIIGELQCDGNITRNWNECAYLDQFLKNVNFELSLIENIQKYYEVADIFEITQYIKNMRYPEPQANRKMKHLSGGELVIAELLFLFWSKNPPDILFLDEPVNHLDLFGVNLLVNLLNSYKGSAVIVSHN